MRVETLLRGPEPFEIGQQVVIRKAMGGKGNYYYGGNVKQVPLGSKGRIIGEGKESLGIELEIKPRIIEAPVKKKTFWTRLREYFSHKENYEDNQNYWKVHPREIVSVALPQTNNESKQDTEVKAPTLEGLLNREVTELPEKKDDTAFNPKLNVREEFAIWIKEQFPNYKTNRESYEKLEKRKSEVRKAAIEACRHGVNTTNTCVRGYFENHLAYFKGSDTRSFYENLSVLINLIEQVAVNIGEHRGVSDWHYGTYVSNTGKRKQR